MKKVKLFITLILAGAFMISCGSGSNISKDAAKKLKNYDTYSYLPNKDTILSQDYNNQQIQETIIATINDNMASEGYAIENRQPDVLVYVHTMFDEKVAVNANPVYTNFSYYRPGHYIGPYYENYTYDNYFTIQRITADDAIKQLPYKEKSIVIDFIDRRTNEILWRGTAPEEEISSKRLERDLRDYVDEIFTKFP
ncbi:uncharacterized protein DUF4136 [Salegentibacter sp. 24]|uniref:DUF4136 domain-containing protein n=1 Tax=Salegentibacter sp. 24 TaxID=2183986 RepID=UPI00105FB4E7|nr:DUF4136 domain-containing protein [Salegentibacter sp. 24]TDN86426.1 uncharacterized protein DUF4136 [Salegentibacter sp. 24]